MVAILNTAEHYIFILRFLLSSSFFFPRLIWAVGDWTSAILPHMAWPWCEFRMQIWKVLHAARWKCRTQKSPKSRHLRTIVQLCRAISLQLRHVSTIGKKIVKQQYLLQMSPQYGERRPAAEIGPVVWVVWCTPANFNGFRVLAALGLLHGSQLVSVSQTLRR